MPKRESRLQCDVCSEAMEVVRVIPAAAHLPELRTFRCTGCECFVTLEPEEVAARKMSSQQAREPLEAPV